jgi:predicted Zn-dependent protease with MMP-like domain
MSRSEVEEAVAEALDRLPFQLAELMSNVVVQVAEAPDRATISRLGLDPDRQTLLGLYTGVPLESRGGFYGNVLPDVILIFRRPLLAACASRSELVRQIQLTLLHEVGHHFGFSDAEMRSWERDFAGLRPDPDPG